MSRFVIKARVCRPGITGATRPDSDFSYDILFLRLNNGQKTNPRCNHWGLNKTRILRTWRIEIGVLSHLLLHFFALFFVIHQGLALAEVAAFDFLLRLAEEFPQ